MVSGEIGTNVPPAEVEVRLTVTALPAVARLPKRSAIATVIGCEAMPATIVCGAVVKITWLAAAAVTVSCCVAEPRPAAEIVSVGVPALVSVYVKLTESAPAGTVNGDAGVNVPAEEVVVRVTVTVLAASTGSPAASSSSTVIVPDAVPAVSV